MRTHSADFCADVYWELSDVRDVYFTTILLYILQICTVFECQLPQHFENPTPCYVCVASIPEACSRGRHVDIIIG
jgi:hypothetical protein